MAFAQGLPIDVGVTAATGLTQWRAVRISTSDVIAQGATGTGGYVHGVLQDDPTTGAHTGQVRVFGGSKAEAATAAISVGNLLVATTAGTVQPATASSAQFILGFALEAAAASTATGRLVSIFIDKAGRGRP